MDFLQKLLPEKPFLMGVSSKKSKIKLPLCILVMSAYHARPLSVVVLRTVLPASDTFLMLSNQSLQRLITSI